MVGSRAWARSGHSRVSVFVLEAAHPAVLGARRGIFPIPQGQLAAVSTEDAVVVCRLPTAVPMAGQAHRLAGSISASTRPQSFNTAITAQTTMQPLYGVMNRGLPRSPIFSGYDYTIAYIACVVVPALERQGPGPQSVSPCKRWLETLLARRRCRAA